MLFTQFGLYFFIFLLTESIINEKAALVCGATSVNYIYAIGLIFTALGYLLFSLLKRITAKQSIIISETIVILSLIGVAAANSPYLLIALSYLGLISLGYTGGCIHYLLSQTLYKKDFALHLGLCSTLAIIAQFIVQNIHMSINGILIFLIITTLILVVISINLNKSIDTTSDDSNVFYLSGISISLRTWIYIAAVAIMSVILGFQDSIIVTKNASGELQLFSYVRLFYAIGLLVAGLVANIKNRVYLPLASGCAMMLSVLAISFFENTNPSYNISMAIMYFYCGFYVMFMTIMFMELGFRKANQRFYAGLGRVVRSVITSLVVLFTTIFNNVDVTVYAILSCILSISLLLIMALSGILIPERTIIKEIPVKQTEETIDEKLEKFFMQYSLTQKEQEAFVKLVTSEMGVQEIADEMAISRRVLQRHIASIYEKTGTKTRVGLLMLFH